MTSDEAGRVLDIARSLWLFKEYCEASSNEDLGKLVEPVAALRRRILEGVHWWEAEDTDLYG